MKKKQAHPLHGTGLQRIADRVNQLSAGGPEVEDPAHHTLPIMDPPEIPNDTKGKVAARHIAWTCNIPPETILLYTNGSKSTDGTTSRAWNCVIGPAEAPSFEGHCQIGSRSDIEDGEIHAIQEGLRCLVLDQTKDKTIYLCADNQNALRALAGGPTAGREYVKAGLEDVKTLQLRGCKVRGKWTPSPKGIPVNEKADTLAKRGLKDHPCNWSRCSLTWLRARPPHECQQKWQACYKLHTKPNRKPFAPTANLNRRSARAIARLHASLTAVDSNPLNPPTPCECGTAPKSARHTLLECNKPNTSTARAILFDSLSGPKTWESITNDNVQPKPLLTFMANVGLLKVRHIIISDEDAREAGYEIGEDV